MRLDGSSMTVTPSGTNETWTVEAFFDCGTGTAIVDFDVSGKPNPPPVPLVATYWNIHSMSTSKAMWEFTDPSGFLALPGYPLNQWVPLEAAGTAVGNVACPSTLEFVYADMHDGDEKQVIVSESLLSITPIKSDQSW